MATSDVTTLLARWSSGDVVALEQLTPIVYDELRRIARRHLARERRDHTLQSTALVHEAYMRLIGAGAGDYQNRQHFFAVAAQVIRRVLVDHARAVNAAKRGGGVQKIFLEDQPEASTPQENVAEVLALHEALDRLAAFDQQQARIVELRYFAGLSIEETAEVVGVSPATIKRDWVMARAWLARELKSPEAKGAAPG
ncbi:MAG: sigma-70 family RNA polymerase sigma factor [Bryobacterales bacterium]|nr:sigma-70 family RNA polymerase sigma factor [Bryobacterales bacterium]